MKQVITISPDDEKIILNTSLSDDYNGIQKKLNMTTSIYNDKITSNISRTNKNFIKDVNKEIEYTNKIRYMIIMKTMYWLVKICKKKIKLLNIKQKIKIKNKDDYINKEHDIRFFGGGSGGGDKYSKNRYIDNIDKYSKNISDNTNKIKSQDFGGNTYSKNNK